MDTVSFLQTVCTEIKRQIVMMDGAVVNKSRAEINQHLGGNKSLWDCRLSDALHL